MRTKDPIKEAWTAKEAALLAEVRRLTERAERAEAENERLKREGSPGVLHEVDRAFYTLTVKERDAARAERDATLARAEKAERERDTMLKDLEAAGWPCRLVELPREYAKLAQAFAGERDARLKAEAALTTARRDALEEETKE